MNSFSSLVLFTTLLVAFSSFGCATLSETTHIQAAGEKTTEKVYRQELPRVEVEVKQLRDVHVVEGRFRICTREFLQTTQPQVEVTERTTSPSAGALAGAGLGALGVGAAIAILGQCENNDSKCGSGRGAAAVLGAGAFVGLEISALVNGIRSIDDKREAPPEINTGPTGSVQCVTKPIQGEDVWAKLDDTRIKLGTLSSNGRLVLTPTLLADLALYQSTLLLGIGEATATLDLRSEHGARCAAVARQLSASTATDELATSLRLCKDTTAATTLEGRIDELRRAQQVVTLPLNQVKSSGSDTARSKSTVAIVLECAKDVAAGGLCDAIVTSVLNIKSPVGHGATGSVCDALSKALAGDTLDGWQIALAGGKALLLALLGEVGEIVAGLEMAKDFGQCLIEQGVFR